MWMRAARFAVLMLAALCSAQAGADDTRKPPPQDPDPGFLEFLGSVDRLAEVNPNYLGQTRAPTARRGVTVAKAPPAPPPALPSPAPDATGVKNND